MREDFFFDRLSFGRQITIISLFAASGSMKHCISFTIGPMACVTTCVCVCVRVTDVTRILSHQCVDTDTGRDTTIARDVIVCVCVWAPRMT